VNKFIRASRVVESAVSAFAPFLERKAQRAQTRDELEIFLNAVAELVRQHGGAGVSSYQGGS